MRIVAGTRKGLALRVPEGRAVRPTPGRVREAAMSILGGFLDGERVLDVCAGSGAMGLELVSRGAASAVFVEPDPDALAALRHNLERARLGAAARVLAQPAEQALPLLAREGARFEVVWLDPPWDAGLQVPLLRQLVTLDLLAPAAEVWVESDGAVTPEELVGAGGGRLEHHDRRRYGNVCVDRLLRIEDLEGPAA